MTKWDYAGIAFGLYLALACILAVVNEGSIQDALTVRAGMEMVR